MANIIGSDRLERLSAILAYLGGNPFAYYPVDMLPGKKQFPASSRDEYLVLEIHSLRQKINDNLALIERARARLPTHWDRVVLEAFESGKAMRPDTFEYGMGAGNYCTDLVSDGTSLYRTRSVSGRDYGQRLEKIATHEEH
jgi:hypothetical protein